MWICYVDEAGPLRREREKKEVIQDQILIILFEIIQTRQII
jgi:hypothetical protein